MKKTPILPLLTLVLVLFVAITQSTAQTANKVTVSAYSVEPTALNEFIANKDNDGNYNLVDPKPVLRVVFQGCDLVRYDNEGLDVFRGENNGTAGVITEDWFDGNVTYPYWVKLGLHENCYITYGSEDENRVSLAIDDPEFEEDLDSQTEKKIIFKFITSDLEYIPSNTEFKLHLPKFSFVDETNDEDDLVSVEYGNSSSDPSVDDEIIFEFKTKECNVVDGSSANYNDSSTEWVEDLPAIVYNHADYIIDDTRKCSQLIVEPGSGIRIKSNGSLTVVDTAYFIGPDTYDLTLRPYLINNGTFDNSTGDVGRTVFTQTVAMTENDNFYRKVRFALPIENCMAESLSTFYDEAVSFQFSKEIFDASSNVNEGQVTLRSNGSKTVNNPTVFYYDDMNLCCRAASNRSTEYDREACFRLNGKINDLSGYSFDNVSKYGGYADEYRLVCSRFSASNVLQAPLDLRGIYEENNWTDARSMWISYGKCNNYFVYNCISGITTFDGDMRKGYLLPQMSYFYANHNSNYDDSGSADVKLLHFEYTKEKLKTYDDIVKSYTKADGEIDVDYKYYRFYVEEKNPDSPDFGNRSVFAVYFMPKEDYDAKVKPYRLGQTANGMPSGSNVTDGHMNPVYDCMVDCDGNSVHTGGGYSSNQTNYYHFPFISASCYNGYDVAGIYSSTYGDGAGYYDYQRGLLIKCLPEPQPCNVGSSEETHVHTETKEVPVYGDIDDPEYNADGSEKTQTQKVCKYQALDLPLIIRANDTTSVVELGILDTNITEGDGITLEDADGTNTISAKLLNGETYNIEFINSKTQIFLNHSTTYGTITVPYTILKFKFVPNPEYSSDAVMPDDPDQGSGSTDPEDLDPNTSGSAGSEGEGGEGSSTGGEGTGGSGSGSGSGETTPTTPTTPEAISTVQTSTVSVVAKQSAVEVRGTQPGAVCAIYDLTGAQVAQKTSAGSTVTLQVPKAGIYFIAVAQENTTKTFKTIVK